MAQLAGMTLERRLADWNGHPLHGRQRKPRLGMAQRPDRLRNGGLLAGEDRLMGRVPVTSVRGTEMDEVDVRCCGSLLA